MTNPDRCTYWITATEQCGRPVAADYYESDPVSGERHIASLCGRHHRGAAKTFATTRGWYWTERETAPSLAVVPA